jgi:uncharacterized protein YoxC
MGLGFNTIFTLAVVAVIVAVLALYLIDICQNLNHVSFTVGTIIIGLRAIEQKTEPLGSVVRQIASDVSSVDQEFAGLAADGDGRKPTGGLPTGTKMYGGNLRGW